MAQSNLIASLLIFALAVVFVFHRSLLDPLIDALTNFRGGPPTPMHPSPANDGALIRKRPGKPRTHPSSTRRFRQYLFHS